MPKPLVLDASAWLAVLLNEENADWARGLLEKRPLCAPELVRYEAANGLLYACRKRRLTMSKSALEDLLNVVGDFPSQIVSIDIWWKESVRLVREYLHAHYSKNVSIEELTGLAYLNRAYLIRSFKKMVGLTPYAYLLQVRVEQAKKLLVQGFTPAQAAVEVGFTDQSHLNRHFKAITGLTPGRYATGHYRTRI